MRCKLALNEAGAINPIITVPTSEEAIVYLHGAAPYKDRALHPLPSVVCIDLKLHGRDGLHLLAWANTAPEFNAMLFLVLSGFHELNESSRVPMPWEQTLFSANRSIPRMLKI